MKEIGPVLTQDKQFEPGLNHYQQFFLEYLNYQKLYPQFELPNFLKQSFSSKTSYCITTSTMHGFSLRPQETQNVDGSGQTCS